MPDMFVNVRTYRSILVSSFYFPFYAQERFTLKLEPFLQSVITCIDQGLGEKKLYEIIIRFHAVNFGITIVNKSIKGTLKL